MRYISTLVVAGMFILSLVGEPGDALAQKVPTTILIEPPTKKKHVDLAQSDPPVKFVNKWYCGPVSILDGLAILASESIVPTITDPRSMDLRYNLALLIILTHNSQKDTLAFFKKLLRIEEPEPWIANPPPGGTEYKI